MLPANGLCIGKPIDIICSFPKRRITVCGFAKKRNSELRTVNIAQKLMRGGIFKRLLYPVVEPGACIPNTSSHFSTLFELI